MLLPRKRLNAIFLLLIQASNSFELHLSLCALDSIAKVARFQLQSIFLSMAIATRFYQLTLNLYFAGVRNFELSTTSLMNE